MNKLAIYEHGDLTAQKSHERCEVHLGRPEREGDQVKEGCWCIQVIVPTSHLTTTTTSTTTNTLRVGALTSSRPGDEVTRVGPSRTPTIHPCSRKGGGRGCLYHARTNWQQKPQTPSGDSTVLREFNCVVRCLCFARMQSVCMLRCVFRE